MGIFLQAVANGTWPWIVAGLSGTIAGMAGFFLKLFNDYRAQLDASHAKLETAMRERYESEIEVVRVLAQATEALERVQQHPNELREVVHDIRSLINELRRGISAGA